MKTNLRPILSIAFVLLTYSVSNAIQLKLRIANNVGATQMQEDLILQRILNSSVYNPRIRASGNDTGKSSATKVDVNLYVRSIQSIDDINMSYKMQITFRMMWRDSRLAYNNLPGVELLGVPYLTLTASNYRIWNPDLFFSNEIDGKLHDLLVPNTYSRIFPDGTVLLSIRLSLTLSCPMVMKNYPFDEQVCSMRMASYGYTSHDLIFVWKRDDPVQVTPDLHLPKFSLESFTTDYCDSHTNTGIYSCLRIDFGFKREFRHYLVKVIIPMTLLVVVAYLALWVGNSGLPISFTILMVMLLGSVATEGSRPVVSYTTAMDVWIGWCLIFCFSAFLICVVTKFLGSETAPQRQEVSEDIEMRPIWASFRLKTESYTGMPLWNKILFVARIVYPVALLIFVISYAISYSPSREKSAQEPMDDNADVSTSELDESVSQPGKTTRILSR